MKGTAESYRCFTRTWWRRGPNGTRVPGEGRKHTMATNCTYDEAREICKRYNDSHDPGFLSRKCEFEQE